MLLLIGYPDDLGAVDSRYESCSSSIRSCTEARMIMIAWICKLFSLPESSSQMFSCIWGLCTIHSFCTCSHSTSYSEYFHPMGDGWLFSLCHIFLKFTLVTSVYSHPRPGTCSEFALIFSFGDRQHSLFLSYWARSIKQPMPSEAVRPGSFHHNPEVFSCLITSVISCGVLAKLLTAPIVPGDLGCALVGVALNLDWPAGQNATVSECFLMFGCVRHSAKILIRFCTTFCISSTSKKNGNSLFSQWFQNSSRL